MSARNLEHPTARVGFGQAQRFSAAIKTADPTALPPAPLARALHLAIEALDEANVDAIDTDELAALLAPVHLVLTALEDAGFDGLSSADVMDLLIRVHDVQGLLETPDLSSVRMGELSQRFRELYSAIVRLRTASVRLRDAWRRLDASRHPITPLEHGGTS